MNLASPSIVEWVDVAFSILIFFIVLIFGRRIIKAVFSRVIHRLDKLIDSSLDNDILNAIAPPLYWLAVIYVFRYSWFRLSRIFPSLYFDEQQLFFILFGLIGFAFVWRLVNNIAIWYERRLIENNKRDLGRQMTPFLRRLVLILLSVIYIIIVLDHFDIEVSGMVTTLGIGSLAIALAAQAALGDTISGFVIMIDRPYRIGDRIEIQELGTWGDVTDIGLRSTRIRTRDNRLVIVPNSVISANMIVNHTYPDTTYRSESTVGVAYGTDLEKARQVIIEAIKDIDGVLPDLPVEALFVEFGDSSLNFLVRWWMDHYLDTRRMVDKVNTAIYKAFNENGIEIPFPQRVVTHVGLPPQAMSNSVSEK